MPDAIVDFPFLRGTSTHAARMTRTTQSISASWYTHPNTGASTHTTCHGSRPSPSRNGTPAQRPFVCRNMPSARNALRARGTSNHAPGCWSAWNARTSGAAVSACAICSAVRPNSSRASRGTGSSVERIVFFIAVALPAQAGSRRRRQAKLTDQGSKVRPVLVQDRRDRVTDHPTHRAHDRQPLAGHLTLALLDARPRRAVVRQALLLLPDEADRSRQRRSELHPEAVRRLARTLLGGRLARQELGPVRLDERRRRQFDALADRAPARVALADDLEGRLRLSAWSSHADHPLGRTIDIARRAVPLPGGPGGPYPSGYPPGGQVRSRCLTACPPALRLQRSCSGPVHRVRSSLWPRSQAAPAVMTRLHLAHLTVPVATMGAHCLQSWSCLRS